MRRSLGILFFFSFSLVATLFLLLNIKFANLSTRNISRDNVSYKLSYSCSSCMEVFLTKQQEFLSVSKNSYGCSLFYFTKIILVLI